jgi:hypothetical protein
MFAVERGPLVLVLESPDLPAGWSVNEVTADPGSIADDDDGTAIDVYRRSGDTDEWPYSPKPSRREDERTRAKLIPYHQWANRGPGTMRAWLPLAESRGRNEETRSGDGEKRRLVFGEGHPARAEPERAPPAPVRNGHSDYPERVPLTLPASAALPGKVQGPAAEPASGESAIGHGGGELGTGMARSADGCGR